MNRLNVALIITHYEAIKSWQFQRKRHEEKINKGGDDLANIKLRLLRDWCLHCSIANCNLHRRTRVRPSIMMHISSCSEIVVPFELRV